MATGDFPNFETSAGFGAQMPGFGGLVMRGNDVPFFDFSQTPQANTPNQMAAMVYYAKPADTNRFIADGVPVFMLRDTRTTRSGVPAGHIIDLSELNRRLAKSHQVILDIIAEVAAGTENQSMIDINEALTTNGDLVTTAGVLSNSAANPLRGIKNDMTSPYSGLIDELTPALAARKYIFMGFTAMSPIQQERSSDGSSISVVTNGISEVRPIFDISKTQVGMDLALCFKRNENGRIVCVARTSWMAVEDAMYTDLTRSRLAKETTVGSMVVGQIPPNPSMPSKETIERAFNVDASVASAATSYEMITRLPGNFSVGVRGLVKMNTDRP